MLVGSVELVPLTDAVGLLGELEELYPGFDDWEPYRALYPGLFAGSQWRISCTSYLIRSGGTTVLVDTGVGPAGLWGWTPEWEEGLAPALEGCGVAADEIDIVFLTHLHVDHVGWNTDREGELVFRSARYLAHPDGVAFARESGRPHVARAIAPVPFEDVADGAELVEGVTAFALPGHFPGHLGLRIESGGARAVLIADTAVHPMLLHEPDAVYVSDAEPGRLRGDAPLAAARARRPGRPRRLRPLSERRHRARRHPGRPGRLGSGVTAFREAFPILLVDDVARTSEFYCSTFGFEETYRNEDEHGPEFAFLALEPYGIGLGRRQPGEERDTALWIYTDDVDAAAAELRAAGAEELLPPTDRPWGERMCSFVDPDGRLIHVGAKAE